jgi:hypothetical protein
MNYVVEEAKQRAAAHAMAQQVQFDLTKNGNEVVLQKSISAQIRQLILHYC